MTYAETRQKSLWIKSGDFLFRYRNAIFPVILFALFFGFPAPSAYFGQESLEEWADVAAIFIVVTGLAVRAAVIGFAYIKRGGLNKRVYAESLVTQGFFGICRNPLYLGNMIIYAGVFLMHGNPAVVLIGTASYFLIYSDIIAAEELFLRQKFGAAYESYCRDVPRWLPALRSFQDATEGMQFNVKRVFMKDYTTIANALMALLLLELLEHYQSEARAEFWQELPYFATAVALVLAVTGMIALAKRRKWLKL